MLKIKEVQGDVTFDFNGNTFDLIADVCTTTKAMLQEAKKHLPEKYFVFILKEITLNIEKEVQDIENQGGAVSLFGQSE